MNTKTVNNYVLSIYFEVVRDRLGKANLVAGLSAFDLTTGDGIFFQTQSLNNDFETVYEDIFRFMESIDPKEVVINMERAFEVAVREHRVSSRIIPPEILHSQIEARLFTGGLPE